MVRKSGRERDPEVRSRGRSRGAILSARRAGKSLTPNRRRARAKALAKGDPGEDGDYARNQETTPLGRRHGRAITALLHRERPIGSGSTPAIAWRLPSAAANKSSPA